MDLMSIGHSYKIMRNDDIDGNERKTVMPIQYAT